MRILFLLCLLTSLLSCDPPKNSEGPNEVSDSLKVDAISELNERIKNDPGDANLYYERAKIFRGKGEFESAISDLERAMRADSTNGEYYHSRGEIHYLNKNIEQGYEDFLHCITLEPKNTDCLLKAAEIEMLLRQYEESIGHINDALKVDDYRSHAYFMKGMIYRETGDTIFAISSYQTATEVDPDYYEAFIALGILYASGKNDFAIEAYNSALEIKPNSVEALYDKAIYLQDTGFRDSTRYTEALDLYDRIIEIDPTNAAAYFNKGYIFLEYLSALDDKNYGIAADWFTQAIEQYPMYYQALYNRGLCFESLGETEKAANDYRKALKIQGDYTPAAKALGRVLDQ